MGRGFGYDFRNELFRLVFARGNDGCHIVNVDNNEYEAVWGQEKSTYGEKGVDEAKMKKLIYFTGDIDSPFFTNEITYFTNIFDEVFVVAYSGNKGACDALAEKYNFKYKLVDSVNSFGSFFRALSSINKNKYVKEELKNIKGGSLRAIKKRLYVLYYLFYSAKVDKILKKYMNAEDEFYAYSFWLSRPAFAVAKLNHEKKVVNAVSRTHRYDLYEEENSLGFLPFRKFICENVDVIYFSSNDTKESDCAGGSDNGSDTLCAGNCGYDQRLYEAAGLH